ncbi:MAG: hypothetical protein ACRBBW_16305 [Cellvibrionaceae bacterium]
MTTIEIQHSLGRNKIPLYDTLDDVRDVLDHLVGLLPITSAESLRDGLGMYHNTLIDQLSRQEAAYCEHSYQVLGGSLVETDGEWFEDWQYIENVKTPKEALVAFHRARRYPHSKAFKGTTDVTDLVSVIRRQVISQRPTL